MTASECTPVEGESGDGSVQFDQYAASPVGAELERVADNLCADFFTVSRNWSREGEKPTKEDVARLENRLSEAQHSLELLKRVAFETVDVQEGG